MAKEGRCAGWKTFSDQILVLSKAILSRVSPSKELPCRMGSFSLGRNSYTAREQTEKEQRSYEDALTCQLTDSQSTLKLKVKFAERIKQFQQYFAEEN